MRRLSKIAVTVAVVSLLSAPVAMAAPRQDPGRGSRIIKIIKKFIATVLEGELSIPKP